MKKVLSFFVTFLMLVNLCVTTFAVEVVPSIEAKLAPAVVEVEHEGQKYAALLVDAATGEPIEGVGLFGVDSDTILELYILPLADAEHAILGEITEDLLAAKAEVDAALSFDDLGEGLTAQINAALASIYAGETGLSAENMVIAVIFDASLVRDKAAKVHVNGEQLIRFMIKPGFKKDQHPILLHRLVEGEDSTETVDANNGNNGNNGNKGNNGNNGNKGNNGNNGNNGSNGNKYGIPNGKAVGCKWRVEQDVEWTDEETMIVTTDRLSVFAFAVDKSALDVDPNGPTSPQTGDDNTGVNFLFGGIAVVCAAAAGYFLVKMSRKEKAE